LEFVVSWFGTGGGGSNPYEQGQCDDIDKIVYIRYVRGVGIRKLSRLYAVLLVLLRIQGDCLSHRFHLFRWWREAEAIA
jgi:hypothetical protein